MRTIWITFATLGLAACGGSETTTPTEPAPAPAPAPAAEPSGDGVADADADAAGELTDDGSGDEAGAGEGSDFASLSEAEVMALGESVYKTGGSGGVACITCHMAEGQGVPGAFPPLVGAGEIMGDCKTHAGYVVKGMQGEITVNGVTYNGVMPAQANLSDEEIAAVITYERKSWGNDYSACTPADVAAVR